MILYVFCTTLPGPLSLISSTASSFYAYMFFLNSPVTASPPHDLKLKLFGPYPTHTVAGAGHCPQHIIVPSAALRKMIGPWLKVCCQCEAEKNWRSWHPSTTYPAEASPWMTWCRGWCPMKKTQVAPILSRYYEVQPVMNSNFLSVFGPLTMYSCSPCSFTFGSVFRIRMRMKTHENSWPKHPDSDSQDQPLAGKWPKIL